jgi:hypothetical protein
MLTVIYSDCHLYEPFILSVVMVNVAILSVTYKPFILSVIMLNVDMLSVYLLF